MQESNSQLRKDLQHLKRQIKARALSMNEPPVERLKERAVISKPPRSFRRVEISPVQEACDYVKHNRQVLLNLRSTKARPVSDLTWTKGLQISPRLQKQSTDDSWREEPEFAFQASKVDLQKIDKELTMQMSFKYCPTCNETAQPIRLIRPARFHS